MFQTIEIFFSYAHADEPLMNDVRRQLIVYERNGQILKWWDRHIPPGDNWRNQIDDHLYTAKIILLFLSPHFIESRYCYEVEGEAALLRHNARQAQVIPVILRPCDWQATPFGNLQALPRDAVPVSRWPDRDEACLNVAQGVMAIVDKLTGSAPQVRTLQARIDPAATESALEQIEIEIIKLLAKHLQIREPEFQHMIDVSYAKIQHHLAQLKRHGYLRPKKGFPFTSYVLTEKGLAFANDNNLN